MSHHNRIRDAAIIFNSLPEQSMLDVLERLDEDCREQLNACVESLDEVSGDEFHRATSSFQSDALGSNCQPSRSLPDPMLWPRGGFSADDDPFKFLKYLSEDVRRQLLENEHPANVAIVLATLSPSLASSFMNELDPQFRIGVIRRLCEIEDINESKVIELRFELRLRARKMLAVANCTKRGLAVAADLLSLSDQKTRDGVIAWLANRDVELSAELEKRVFKMENLADFTDRQIRNLLKVVDTTAWAGALRSTIPSVASRILKCMAPRAAEIVSGEMAAFNPLDVKAMQWSVEQVVREAMKIQK